MKKIVFILFFLITTVTRSEAAVPETWRICGSSVDCVIIPTYCGGWAAVNQDHAQEARQYYDEIGSIKKCGKGAAPRPDPTCVDNLCEPANVWKTSSNSKSSSPQAEPAIPLQLTIIPEKTVYTIGEKIKIAIKLKNSYGEKLQVVDLKKNEREYLIIGHVLHFEIKNSQGEAVHFERAKYDYVPSDKNFWLNPGETMETTIILNDKEKVHSYYADLTVPGEYQVSVEYFDSFEYRDYSGSIPGKQASSNAITIQIEEATE